jgi:glycyl-tRNA synthetase beta chain
MVTKNLLVELFVEELPPKSLKKLGEAFAAGLADGLRALGLATEQSAVTPFASPRRLAAHISGVSAQADDKAQSQKLMPVSVGLDAEGQATPALLKKLAALGADASVVPQLKRQRDGKADALFFDSVVRGATLAEGLQKALDEALAKLPIPKVMQYQLEDGWTSVNFVRPAHGLVALFGADVVPVKALGLQARRETLGHRFEAPMSPVVLQDADHYARQLEEQGAVIASFAARHGEIVRQLNAAAHKEGLVPIDDAALLDEVTALVERPNVLLCRFDEEFLGVPPECLILTMKANQKYFPLLDAQGKLTNKFLVVSNIRPEDPSRVIEGNERVVRPRLADAKFFFDQDRKRPLRDRLDGLKKVVYLNKLGDAGDMYSRMDRVRTIARTIGQQLGGPSLGENAYGAATLAKADLLTDMVGEFPELQGVMGGYYARHDGELEDIAVAIEDHYKPRFAGDKLPRNPTGAVVALADKLETLAGLFSIGQVPTGDKDPFALRRHALGVVRIVVEQGLPFSLQGLVSTTYKEFPGLADRSWVEVATFILDRAKGYFAEQGISAKAIDAVMVPMGLASPLNSLAPIVREADRFIRSPEGQELAEANKRITNILRKSGYEVPVGMSPRVLQDSPAAGLFEQDEERALYAALLSTGEAALKLREANRFAESLNALVPLSEPVKFFFAKVMVNVENEQVRENRISLLRHARAYMNQVADLSLMAS